MNNKIYKLNLNKLTEYIHKVNPSIRVDLDEDTEKLIEMLQSMKHTQPEYMIQAIIPAFQCALIMWLQSHGYHVNRSSFSILQDFGTELINYAKFAKTMIFFHELTEDDNHDQKEI